MEGDGVAAGGVDHAHQLAPVALPWWCSAFLGLVAVGPYLGGWRRRQPAGDGGGAHAGGSQGCDCRSGAPGREGQGVGQPFGDVHRSGRVLQVRASQHDHGVRGWRVGPLGQAAVDGWGAVSGDVDELHGAEVRKDWP